MNAGGIQQSDKAPLLPLDDLGSIWTRTTPIQPVKGGFQSVGRMHAGEFIFMHKRRRNAEEIKPSRDYRGSNQQHHRSDRGNKSKPGYNSDPAHRGVLPGSKGARASA